MSELNPSAVAHPHLPVNAPPQSDSRHRQYGAVSIEFAALFVLFFTIFYAILAYSIPMLLVITYRHLSAEAIRAAVRVDPAQDNYPGKVIEEVNRVIDESWLPEDWRGGGCPAPDNNWLPYGDISFGYLAIEQLNANIESRTLYVCMEREYDQANAILPVIKLGAFSIPSLPGKLRGSAYGHL